MNTVRVINVNLININISSTVAVHTVNHLTSLIISTKCTKYKGIIILVINMIAVYLVKTNKKKTF